MKRIASAPTSSIISFKVIKLPALFDIFKGLLFFIKFTIWQSLISNWPSLSAIAFTAAVILFT